MHQRMKRIAALFLSALLVLYAAALYHARPSYHYAAAARDIPFETFLAERLTESRSRKTRPGNEERLLRASPGRTPLAFLFIHGFGASRAGGESVVDPLSREFGANTYYMRLPGHGTDTKDHTSTTFPDYLHAAEDTLMMMPKLGERTVVFGSSTGALIATYLASRYPDRVEALVLASPFYRFADPTANVLLALPGGINLVEAVYGPDRFAGWKDDPEKRRVDGYEDHWLVHQKYRALLPVNNLRRFITRDSVYRRITAPVLLLYYYRDETHQDSVVDVKAMHQAFRMFGRESRPNPLNRMVAVADGNHILMSRYVRTDKAFIMKETRSFLKSVVAAPGRKSAGRAGP